MFALYLSMEFGYSKARAILASTAVSVASDPLEPSDIAGRAYEIFSLRQGAAKRILIG